LLPKRLTQLVFAILALLAAATLISKLAPDTPEIFRVLADSAAYVEMKTGWSPDTVTDFIVVIIVFGLLSAERALRGLTRFFLNIIIVAKSEVAKDTAPKIPETPARTTWVWTGAAIWALSVGTVHIFD
jgi:hypothetical protein